MGTFGVSLPRVGRPAAEMGGLSTQSEPAPPATKGEQETPTFGGSSRKKSPGKTQASTGARFPSAVGALSRTAAGEHPERFGAGRVNQAITDRVRMESLKNLNPRAVEILQSVIQKQAFTQVERFSNDTLNSTKGTLVDNALFSPRERTGLARFRPEVLQVIDFLPAYEGISGDHLTGAGQLLELEYQALTMRNTLLKTLMGQIEEQDPTQSTSARALRELGKAFLEGRGKIKEILNVYADWLEALDQYRLALDVKTLPMFSFDTQRFRTLPEVWETYLGFSRGALSLHTDTKVLGQVLQDLGWILNNYSPFLVGANILGRATDTNPVIVQKSYDSVGNRLGFRPEDFGSKTTIQRASEPSWFERFLGSLPTSPQDRIKVLMAVLSKEVRVSKILGNPATQTRLRDLYQTQATGNPFDNVVGIPGTNVLDDPLGPPGCLASLTQVVQTDGSRVLPFESKYFDDQDTNRAFTPGGDFFIDSVIGNLPKKGGFDTKPFLDFVGRYQKVIQDAKTTVVGLLEAQRPQIPTQPLRLFQGVCSAYLGSVSGVKRNMDQAVLVALFQLMARDQDLKLKVFEFTLLLGLATRQGDKNDKLVFQRIAADYKGIQGFASLKTGKKDRVDLLKGHDLGPWIESLAQDIESRVVELTRQSGTGTRTLGKRNPKTTVTDSKTANLEGGGTSKQGLPEGSLREILMRCAQVSGTPSQNVLKSALDAITGLDAAGGGSGEWLLPDGSGRSRFHGLSTSTMGLMVFEVFSSMVALYGGVQFQTKGNTSKVLTLLFDDRKLRASEAALQDAITRSPTQDPDTYHDHLNVPALTAVAAGPGIRTPREVQGNASSLGIRSALGSRTSPVSVTPVALGAGFARTRTISRQTTGEGDSGVLRIVTGGPGDRAGTLAPSGLISRGALNLVPTLAGIVPTSTSPRAIDMIDILRGIDFGTLALVMVQTQDITEKLDNENRVVENLFHILEVVGKRLETAASQMGKKFTDENLLKFYQGTGMTFEDLKDSVLEIPSQVRTSAYLYDWYSDRVTVGTTAFVDDLPPPVKMDALSAWLKDSSRREALVHKTLKLVTVGLPAGLSGELSDRVRFGKAGVNLRSTDTDDKQFDLVSLNVYKRDARFDDLVFKPQSFLFDVSLFLPFGEVGEFPGSWESWLRTQRLKDYQSVLRPVEVSLGDIDTKPQYAFLGNSRRRQLFENHLVSETLDLYAQLLTGMTMSEDTFLEAEVRLSDVVQGTVARLIIAHLRESGKQIQGDTPEAALASPNLDDETKDIITVLSYGNLVFHTEYLKKNILGMKKFDRVFTFPLNTEEFEVDQMTTCSTAAGKELWGKETFQALLEHRPDGRTLLAKRTKEDIIFSDYFVVAEGVTK